MIRVETSDMDLANDLIDWLGKQQPLDPSQTVVTIGAKPVAELEAGKDCEDCKARFPAEKSFQCFYCKGWICESCAVEHFGPSKERLEDKIAILQKALESIRDGRGCTPFRVASDALGKLN
jgi:hypothetical protein